jgi:hypothetical protein
MLWRNVSRNPWPPTASFEGMKPQPTPIPSTLGKAKEFSRRASDAAWEGNHELALRYRTISDTFMARHLSGDTHEPPF